MDDLAIMAVARARTALDMVGPTANTAARAKAFIAIAFTMLRHERTSAAIDALKSHSNGLVQKAVAHALGDGVWRDDNAAALAAGYLASIAELSILDQIKRYARVLPVSTPRVLIASNSVGNVVTEGDPKPVKNLALGMSNVTPTKSASIVVLTKELAMVGGDAVMRLFEIELSSAVTRSTNRGVLTALGAYAQSVAGTGDALERLRLGLRAAGPSNGYVVAAPTADAIDLATRTENKGGMGVRGGTFVPGVEVVAVDDQEGMTIIPASRLAVYDQGLEVRSAEHASIDMRDTPTADAVTTSLWQSNLIGLLIERNWHLAGDAHVVVVE